MTQNKKKLWMAASPIGNLSDSTLRLQEVLDSVSVILAEDTRNSKNLLSGLGLKINKKWIRFDGTKSVLDGHQILKNLDEDVVYLSDAGTPGVSDPGSKLVKAAIDLDWVVSPVPGPSSVLATLSVVPWENPKFSFMGFFPRSDGDRKDFLKKASYFEIFYFFESPMRILETIEFLKNNFNFEAEWVFAKELTKIHERIFYLSLNEFYEFLFNRESDLILKGEWVLGCRIKENKRHEKNDDLYKNCIENYKTLEVSQKSFAKFLSKVFSKPSREIYQDLLRIRS